MRVPGVVGQTPGIIGAVILGQAAVAAALISPILIIAVAITGIGIFAIPNFSLSFAVRILRFGFIPLGGIGGLFGHRDRHFYIRAFTLPDEVLRRSLPEPRGA